MFSDNEVFGEIVYKKSHENLDTKPSDGGFFRFPGQSASEWLISGETTGIMGKNIIKWRTIP